MLLVHALFLPGFVVIVSMMNPLRVHALRGVKDDPASVLRDTGSGATADEENRMSAGTYSYENWEGVTAYWSNLIHFAQTNCKPSRKSPAHILDEIKDKLKSHFQNTLKYWESANEGVDRAEFHSSGNKQALIDLFNDVNEHLPEDEHFDIAAIGSVVMNQP